MASLSATPTHHMMYQTTEYHYTCTELNANVWKVLSHNDTAFFACKNSLSLYQFSLHPRFGRNAKIIHFIGPVKPWQHRYLREVDSVILSPGTYSSQNVAQDFIRRWWQVYCSTEQVCRSYRNTRAWLLLLHERVSICINAHPLLLLNFLASTFMSITSFMQEVCIKLSSVLLKQWKQHGFVSHSLILSPRAVETAFPSLPGVLKALQSICCQGHSGKV